MIPIPGYWTNAVAYNLNTFLPRCKDELLMKRWEFVHEENYYLKKTNYILIINT